MVKVSKLVCFINLAVVHDSSNARAVRKVTLKNLVAIRVFVIGTEHLFFILAQTAETRHVSGDLLEFYLPAFAKQLVNTKVCQLMFKLSIESGEYIQIVTQF